MCWHLVQEVDHRIWYHFRHSFEMLIFSSSTGIGWKATLFLAHVTYSHLTLLQVSASESLE